VWDLRFWWWWPKVLRDVKNCRLVDVCDCLWVICCLHYSSILMMEVVALFLSWPFRDILKSQFPLTCRPWRWCHRWGDYGVYNHHCEDCKHQFPVCWPCWLSTGICIDTMTEIQFSYMKFTCYTVSHYNLISVLPCFSLDICLHVSWLHLIFNMSSHSMWKE
jgi:hypothetical protein